MMTSQSTKPLAQNLRPVGDLSLKVGQKWGDTLGEVRKPRPHGQEKRRNIGAEKRNAERIWQHKQRKQRQNVAESPYWQSTREGATDAFCWSNVKKNRWLEVSYVLNDIPSSARQLLKLLPALPHFLGYPYIEPREPKSTEHIFLATQKSPCNIHISILEHIRWHYDDLFLWFSLTRLLELKACVRCLLKISSTTGTVH